MVVDGDGTDTKTRIATAAIALFAQRGVDNVSMREIAEEVGIRTPSLYNHWKSRDELVTHLFRDGYGSYAATLREAVEDLDGFPARKRIEAMLRAICQLHRDDHNRFVFLMLTHYRALPHLRLGVEGPFDLVLRVIGEGVQAGEFKGVPLLLSSAVVGIVLQAATLRYYGRLEGTLVDHEDTLVGMAMSVLGDAV